MSDQTTMLTIKAMNRFIGILTLQKAKKTRQLSHIQKNPVKLEH
jgi:hypothetical protein